MKEIRTAHGFKIIENVGLDHLDRREYRYYINYPTHFNHFGGTITRRMKALGGCAFEVSDFNSYDIRMFKTKRECLEWLLNRIDRALLNETPNGRYCPE